MGWMKPFNYLWNREIQFKYCIMPLLLPLHPLPPPLQFLLYPEHFQKHCWECCKYLHTTNRETNKIWIRQKVLST